MRIGFDAKRFFHNSSGLGNYSRDLIRILAEHHPELSLHLYANKLSDRGKSILEKSNVHFTKLTGLFSRQIGMGLTAGKEGMEIFHGLSGELPWRWGSAKIKKVVTIHDLIFERYPQYYSLPDRHIHRWKFQKAADQADALVAISEQTKKDIIQFLKVDPAKVEVIYQGCHPAFKKRFTSEEKEVLRQKLDLPSKYILCVGTLEPRKGQLKVVNALAETDIPLVLVGRKKGKYYAQIKKSAEAGKVKILPREVPDMESLSCLYQMAAFSVYVSEFEGFGIPVIESLFAGCPIICSNRSSLPEAGGAPALFVDPENEADIRAKILYLWNHPAEGRRRLEQVDAHLSKFRDEAIAENWMTLYQKLLS